MIFKHYLEADTQRVKNKAKLVKADKGKNSCKKLQKTYALIRNWYARYSDDLYILTPRFELWVRRRLREINTIVAYDVKMKKVENFIINFLDEVFELEDYFKEN